MSHSSLFSFGLLLLFLHNLLFFFHVRWIQLGNKGLRMRRGVLQTDKTVTSV